LCLFGLSKHTQAQYLEAGVVTSDHQYRAEGKISNMEIDMRFRISNNNSISGHYYYKKYFIPINILGFVRNDSLQIFEFDQDINKSGRFVCTLSDQIHIIGEWINLKNNRRLPLTLKSVSQFKNLSGQIFIKNGYEIKYVKLETSKISIPDEFNLINITNKNGKKYLLFRLGGLSKPESDGRGHCGAGIEEELVWMEIDSNLNILRVQTYLINSCIYNYDSLTEDSSWHDHIFQLEGSYYTSGNEKIFQISYDKSRPEKGLTFINISE
jgi:hypothetical protein